MAQIASLDGTRVVYDDLGEDPALIIIGGALNTRAATVADFVLGRPAER
ncbi:hypothetical protein [Aeromicrobium sp. PE09-221]|nr:hypothetical protein [Aeromicrobium sp. PE09-221]